MQSPKFTIFMMTGYLSKVLTGVLTFRTETDRFLKQ